MTAFSPKTRLQLYNSGYNFLRAYTSLTDYEIGSVCRTLLETVADSLDEAYFQMVQLLSDFNIRTASGVDVDRRALDDGLYRRSATNSTVTLNYYNTRLQKTTVESYTAAAALTIFGDDTSLLPTAPFTVRIGEGTVNVEDVDITLNDTSANELTIDVLTPLVNNHNAEESICLVSGGDITVVAGTTVETKPSVVQVATQFISTETGVIIAGNYYSNQVTARSVGTGILQNVGAGTINVFSGTPPFEGAGVANITAAGGGRDRESDADFIARILLYRQSLSKGTGLSIKEGLLDVTDPLYGRTVTDVYVYEDWENDIVIVYIDDGTAFTPEQIVAPQDSVGGGGAAAGDGTVTLSDNTAFPTTGWVLLSPEDGTQREIIEYSSKNNANVITLKAPSVLAYDHDASDAVLYLYRVAESAEEGQKMFQIPFTAVVMDSYRFFLAHNGDLDDISELVDGTSYLFNMGNGQIEILGTGLEDADMLFVHADYYSGLVHEAQKVLDGDPDDQENYPGYKAAGIIATVATPTKATIDVEVVISVKDEAFANKDEILQQVKAVEESYINALKMGEEWVFTEAVRIGKNVSTDIKDLQFVTPTENVVFLETEKASSVDESGNSTVTVS